MTNHARTFCELFEPVAARSPNAVAVSYGDERLSYGALNAAANRLARELIARGVGPDVTVGVCIPRSADLVVAVVAILKAGGAYLPLDASYPASRIEYMIEDAEPALVLTASDAGHGVAPVMPLSGTDIHAPQFARSCADRDGANIPQRERLGPLRPEHLLYVIYTSGSSGVPKGVALTHEGLADLEATQRERFAPAPGENVLQWASISFDAAWWDISLALFSGATLVMADADDLLPGSALHTTLRSHDIDHAVLPPVALSLTDADGVLIGGTIMSTGDACTPALLRKWAPGRRMFNGYGPTEVTVGASIAGPLAADGPVDIGTPWVGTRVYVVGDDGTEVAVGDEGELCIAGTGLARGYLNQPELTAERFPADLLGSPGARMYRTGDRGWQDTAGRLHFSGRLDNQVKLRGFRIELGEIDAALADETGVAVAATLVDGDAPDAVVVAYVVAEPGREPDPTALRRGLSTRLPPYMVPTEIRVVADLPQSTNGKVDRRALLERHRSQAGTAVESGSATPAEFTLSLLRTLLRRPQLDPSDQLFDVGANSMVVARVVTEVRRECGVRLPMRSVFEARTVADVLMLLDQEQTV